MLVEWHRTSGEEGNQVEISDLVHLQDSRITQEFGGRIGDAAFRITAPSTFRRQNFLLRSEEIDNASWAKSATVTANVDGVADEVDDTSASVGELVSQIYTPASLAAGDTYTLRIKVKKGADRIVALELIFVTGGVTKNCRLRLDTVTGDTNTTNVDSSTVEDDNEGYWLVHIVGTNDDGDNTEILCRFYPAYEATLGAGFDATQTGAATIKEVQLYSGDSVQAYEKTVASVVDIDMPVQHWEEIKVRERAQNLLLRSEEFDNASWSKSVTVTADQDGVADKLTDNSASVAQLAVQVYTPASLDNKDRYTFCIKVKKGSAANITAFELIYVTGGTTVNARVQLDTSSGQTSASANVLSSSVEDDGRGYWILSFSAENTDGDNTEILCRVYPAWSASLGVGADVTLQGDVLVKEAQLYRGTVKQSYVKTTTVAVTQGRSLFGGYATQIRRAPYKKGTTAEIAWDILCSDYNILLDRTNVPSLNYTATADNTIITTVFGAERPDIDVSNVSNVANATLTRENITLREMLEEITEQTQGVFYITADKELWYHDDTSEAAAFSLTETPDFDSSFPFLLESLALDADFTTPANSVTVLGKLTNNVTAFTGSDSDATSIAEYDTFERVITERSVNSNAEAALIAEAEVLQFANPREQGSVVFFDEWSDQGIHILPRTLTAEVGKLLTITASTYLISGNYRINRLEMTWEKSKQRTTFRASFGTFLPDLAQTQRCLYKIGKQRADTPVAVPSDASVSGTSVQTGVITGTHIASATITAANISSLTITAGEIADLTITNSKIANLTIQGGKVAVGTLTSDKLDATEISVGGGGSKPGKFGVYNSGGTQIGFIGVEGSDEGGWFKTLSVGGTSYATGVLRADASGNVTIADATITSTSASETLTIDSGFILMEDAGGDDLVLITPFTAGGGYLQLLNNGVEHFSVDTSAGLSIDTGAVALSSTAGNGNFILRNSSDVLICQISSTGISVSNGQSIATDHVTIDETGGDGRIRCFDAANQVQVDISAIDDGVGGDLIQCYNPTGANPLVKIGAVDSGTDGSMSALSTDGGSAACQLRGSGDDDIRGFWVGSDHVLSETVLTMQERSDTPANPASGVEARRYIKDDKFVIQFNDAGTVRYKYLDLTGTTVTWTHTTTPP